MIVRYGMTAFNLWSGREISTVLMPMSFSVWASTTEDDIRKMVLPQNRERPSTAHRVHLLTSGPH